MESQQDFLQLANELSRSEGRNSMLPVIEKELLHYEILQAMDKARFLDKLTFQGGTCLRLCYSSERYSEDLDFVGGVGFNADVLEDLDSILKQTLTRRYNLTVNIKNPDFATQPKSVGKQVSIWKIGIVVAPGRPALPQQRISIEIASVPAHTSQARSMIVHYPALPASYRNVVIRCEAPEEICADKLKTFICAQNIRFRDLWDLRWLASYPNFDQTVLPRLLQHKLDDYNENKCFIKNLERLNTLGRIVESKEFIGQMRRFLPQETIEETIERGLFRENLIETVLSLYRVAKVNS